MRKAKEFDINRSWIKLILASLLLNAIIAAAFFTSAKDESPESLWMIEVQEVRYQLFPVEEDSTEIKDMHTNSRQLAKEECIACHGDKKSSELTLHRLHLTSELLPGLQCNDCHRSISLEERTNEFAARLVDVSFCKQCHSPFPGLEPNSPMTPTDFEVECTTCHTGKSAFKHQEHYLSHVIAPKECKGCHGGRVLPWPARHESPSWLEDHGLEALNAEGGEEECFVCHEGQFRFCEKCHEDKPPSHKPREAWLRDHSGIAQDDTRKCFTCHEPDFCKECHVNHEADWFDKHPAYVRANDSTECWECHSQSFCAYCHVRQGEMGLSEPEENGS